MGKGYHRGTGGSSSGLTDNAFLAVVATGIAFPFGMYGLARLAEIVGDRYGAVAGFAVFLTPAWLVLIAVLLRKGAGNAE